MKESKSLEERAEEYAWKVWPNPMFAQEWEECKRDYIIGANKQKAIDEEQANKMLVVLTAKILEPLGAGLPSCYYEAMENWTIEGIAEIAVQLIKNTRAMMEE